MREKPKQMNTTNTNYDDETIMNQMLEEALEEMHLNPAPSRSNEEWIKALRSRLANKKKELARLLDFAAENEDLLPMCLEYRQEIDGIKRRLAAHRMMRNCTN